MKSNSKETDRNKEQPKLAVKFANMVFVLGVVFSFLVIVYAVYRLYFSNDIGNWYEAFYAINILCFSILATFFGLGYKRLSNNLKVNLSVLIFTTVISIYGFEIYLELEIIPGSFFQEKLAREKKAKQMGIPFDTRDKFEVFEDILKSKKQVIPNFYPYKIINSNGLNGTKGKIFPVSGIANTKTILGNEEGYYPVVETDEYGFTNKRTFLENNPDIILIGDSFTEGSSVHQDNNIGSVLRKSGFNSMSLGKGGNGVLIELASLKEYAMLLKPKIVLWLYCANDVNNLKSEMASDILLKYINNDDYSQNLMERQDEIDTVLTNYIMKKWKQERMERSKKDPLKYSLRKVATLNNIKALIKSQTDSGTIPDVDLINGMFKNIIRKAHSIVNTWGGRMYFIYLPLWELYSPGAAYIENHEHLSRGHVLKIIKELNVPLIDMHEQVFAPHSDPLSLFPFRLRGHYNSEGYRLVAETIVKTLKSDGYVPTN